MFATRLKTTAVVLLAGFLCAAVSEEPSKPGKEPKGLKELEGEWKVVALEADAREAPTEVLKEMRWVIKGSELQARDAPDMVHDKASIQIDPSQARGHIDLVSLEGPNKGKVTQGIYKMKDGQLTICLRDPAATVKSRPTEFKTEKGSGLGLITLERIKQPAGRSAGRHRPYARWRL